MRVHKRTFQQAKHQAPRWCRDDLYDEVIVDYCEASRNFRIRFQGVDGIEVKVTLELYSRPGTYIEIPTY